MALRFSAELDLNLLLARLCSNPSGTEGQEQWTVSREEEIREESLGDLRLFANLVFQCYYWSAFLKVQRPNGALYLTSKLFLR